MSLQKKYICAPLSKLNSGFNYEIYKPKLDKGAQMSNKLIYN